VPSRAAVAVHEVDGCRVRPLASDRSAYTTGCIFSIDGGLAARWS